MERIEIDCQNGGVKIFALSPEEEVELVKEKDTNRQREIAEQKKSAKQLLIKALAELREMRLNRDIFDDTDLAEKQGEIDALKSRLV